MVDEHGTLRGLITIKDIEKSERFPNACKDALGPAALRRRRRRRRGQHRARAGAGGRGRRRDRGRHRARPLAARARRRSSRCAGTFSRAADRRRQRRDGRGRRGADQGGRLGGEGRRRPRLDLHDARGRRRRRAAVHRGARRRARRAPRRRAGDRRRRHQVLGRPGQGARRRRVDRDDRLALRRHRRGARRGRALPGPLLQGVPRHGLARRDDRRQRRPLLPGRGPARRASWCPRASRAASPTAAA